jgi:hypothetical protein
MTARFALIVTLQVALPVQSPDQPAKEEVPLGAAVNDTDVPLGTEAVHVVPLQVRGKELPATVALTVPAPVPAKVTVNVYDGNAVKVAVTERAVVIKTAQVAPVQSPDQPAKEEVPLGAAVTDTDVPLGTEAVQVAPLQVRGKGLPATMALTVPPPLPAMLTVSV